MRSRYSAFALGDADYLLATWHRSTAPASLDLADDVEWRRLEIRCTTAGGEADEDGTVEFVASYWDAANQQHGQVHEISAFVRRAGRWLYVGPVDVPSGRMLT